MMRNKKNLRFPECSPSGLDLCAPAPLLRLDSSPFTIRDLPPAHNPDEQFLHIGTTYYLALDKKQIVKLENQIIPSPPTHNPDEQFLHIRIFLGYPKELFWLWKNPDGFNFC